MQDLEFLMLLSVCAVLRGPGAPFVTAAAQAAHVRGVPRSPV